MSRRAILFSMLCLLVLISIIGCSSKGSSDTPSPADSSVVSKQGPVDGSADEQVAGEAHGEAEAQATATDEDKGDTMVDNPQIQIVDGNFSLTDYRDKVGKIFEFEVVGTNSGSVWGTDIYTDDSILGLAAVHAGVLKVGERGRVRIAILAGQSSYEGTHKNGITSGGWGNWHGSYQFIDNSLLGIIPSPPATTDTNLNEALINLINNTKSINEMYYEYEMRDGTTEVKGAIWLKGQKIKQQMSVEGETTLFYINFEDEVAYMYQSATNIATKLDLDSMWLPSGQNTAEYISSLDPTTTKVLESTIYNNQQCLVISTVDKGDEVKHWISLENGLPLKLEAVYDGVLTIIEFKNISFDTISEDIFNLPEGAEIKNTF